MQLSEQEFFILKNSCGDKDGEIFLFQLWELCWKYTSHTYPVTLLSLNQDNRSLAKPAKLSVEWNHELYQEHKKEVEWIKHNKYDNK